MTSSLRVLILVAFPSLAAILGFLWLRRRKTPSDRSVTLPPAPPPDSRDESVVAKEPSPLAEVSGEVGSGDMVRGEDSEVEGRAAADTAVAQQDIEPEGAELVAPSQENTDMCGRQTAKVSNALLREAPNDWQRASPAKHSDTDMALMEDRVDIVQTPNRDCSVHFPGELSNGISEREVSDELSEEVSQVSREASEDASEEVCSTVTEEVCSTVSEKVQQEVSEVSSKASEEVTQEVSPKAFVEVMEEVSPKVSVEVTEEVSSASVEVTEVSPKASVEVTDVSSTSVEVREVSSTSVEVTEKVSPKASVEVTDVSSTSVEVTEVSSTSVEVTEEVSPKASVEVTEVSSTSVAVTKVSPKASVEVAEEVSMVTKDVSEDVSDEVSAVTSSALDSRGAAHVTPPPCTHTAESPTGKCSVASSNGSDAHSEMSADSGQGSLADSGVESAVDSAVESAAPLTEPAAPADPLEPTTHEFDFPTDLCGRLIGKFGKNINILKNKSGAEISVRRKPYTSEHQVILLRGNRQQVDAALTLIKQRFPSEQFPNIDYSPVDVKKDEPVLSPEIMQISVPEGVLLDVVVSSVVTANYVFIQQPTHPTFAMLYRQRQCMSACYSQEGIVPQLPRPLEVGVLCAAPMFDSWFRAQIVQAYPDRDECDIKFVDFGGYASMHGSMLRQIRSDFTSLPFQATECYLANVVPPKDLESFPEEATAVLEELVHGQALQAEVVAREEDGVPYIQLYLVGHEESVLVNRELVNRGVAQWQES